MIKIKPEFLYSIYISEIFMVHVQALVQTGFCNHPIFGQISFRSVSIGLTAIRKATENVAVRRKN